MDGPVRLGIIGAGTIGREHIGYAENLPDVTAVALADPAPGAADVAAEHGLTHYADHLELLARERPDAVVVAVPNALHADVAVAALERGVPALVEKPIAGDLDDARRIVAAQAATGVPVLVGHQRRYAPDVVAARDFLSSGGVGEVVSVALLNTWRKDEAYFDVEWRTRRGGGPVFINLIHDLDAARYLVGEIASVVAVGSTRHRGLEVADTVAAVLTFADGALGTALSSDAAAAPWCWDLTSGYGPYFPPPPPGDTYFVAGTEASLALPSLTVYRHGEGNHWKVPMTVSTLERREVNSYEAQLAHLAEVVRGRAEPRVSARDAFRTLAVAVAIDRSQRTGAPVRVEQA